MGRFLLGLFALAACGKVNPVVDAGVSDDVVVADAEVDAAPPQFVTAILTTTITTFTAGPGILTKVPYGTPVFDDEGELNPTTNRYTAKLGGDYLLCASLSTGQVGTTHELDVYINNARHKAFARNRDIAQGCIAVRLAAGDFVEVWMGHDSTSTLQIGPDPFYNYLLIERLPSSSSVLAATNAAVDSSMTLATVPFAAEQRDELGYEPTTSVMTATQPGDVFTCASLAFGTSLDGELDTFHNAARGVVFGEQGVAQGCRSTRLAANDTLEIKSAVGTIASQSIPHDPLWNYMTHYRLPVRVQADTVSSYATTNGGFTKILYAGESIDTHNEFSSGTFTASEDGDYLVCIGFTDNASSATEIDLFRSGARLWSLAYQVGVQNGCSVVRLTTNQTLDLRSSSSQGKTITPDPLRHWLQISKLR